MITVEQASEFRFKLGVLYNRLNEQIAVVKDQLSTAMKMYDTYKVKYPAVDVRFVGNYMDQKLKIYVSEMVNIKLGDEYKVMIRDYNKVDDHYEMNNVDEIIFPEKNEIDLGKWRDELNKAENEDGKISINSKGLIQHMKTIMEVSNVFKMVSFCLNQFLNAYIDNEPKLKQKQEAWDHELVEFMKKI